MSRRPRTLPTLLAAASIAGASTLTGIPSASAATVLHVTDVCTLKMADGKRADLKVAELSRSGYRGVVEVRLPVGQFTCLGNPDKDDQVFVDDQKFYGGAALATWGTVPEGVSIRIAPEGVLLPAKPGARGTACKSMTRISGLDPATQRASYGPWLKVNPPITSATVLPLELRCIAVSHYVHSGVTVDPSTPGGDEDHVTLSGLTFTNMMFQNIGTAWFTTKASGAARPADEKTAAGRSTCSNGFAGLFLKQVEHSTVADSTFVSVANRDVPDGPTSDSCAQTAHGIYLRHDSSGNTLVNNLFRGISGAAIDLAVRSNDNLVSSSIFNNTGYIDRHDDGKGNVVSVAAPWVLTYWDKMTGSAADMPLRNVLAGATGNGLPASRSTETVTGQVPKVSCTLDTGRRGIGDECTASIRAIG